MTKKEILDYITETPGNTNRAVLGDMLDSFGGGSGGSGVAGYECVESKATLFDSDVTTSTTPVGGTAQISVDYGTSLPAQLFVTFDGVEYNCPLKSNEYSNYYGAEQGPDTDYSEYPFTLQIAPDNVTTSIWVEAAGTNHFKIETFVETANITPCFKKAVNAASVLNIKLTGEIITVGTDNYSLTDTLAEDAFSAFREGRTIVFGAPTLVSHAIYATPTSDSFVDNSGNISLYTIDESNGYLVGLFEHHEG